jgi:hypothetical protein
MDQTQVCLQLDSRRKQNKQKLTVMLHMLLTRIQNENISKANEISQNADKEP